MERWRENTDKIRLCFPVKGTGRGSIRDRVEGKKDREKSRDGDEWNGMEGAKRTAMEGMG